LIFAVALNERHERFLVGRRACRTARRPCRCWPSGARDVQGVAGDRALAGVALAAAAMAVVERPVGERAAHDDGSSGGACLRINASSAVMTDRRLSSAAARYSAGVFTFSCPFTFIASS